MRVDYEEDTDDAYVVLSLSDEEIDEIQKYGDVYREIDIQHKNFRKTLYILIRSKDVQKGYD